jgi:hypothetical protein
MSFEPEFESSYSFLMSFKLKLKTQTNFFFSIHVTIFIGSKSFVEKGSIYKKKLEKRIFLERLYKKINIYVSQLPYRYRTVP